MPSDLITDQLLNALAMQESRNNPNAVGDKKLKYPAYGAYQMREPAFLDVQRLRPEAAQGVSELSSILGNAILQRQLAAAYLDIITNEYRMKTEEEMLGAYNAGVGNVRKGKIPTKYIEGVRSFMK